MDPSSPRTHGDALLALSSLITRKTRGDGTNAGDAFHLMFKYLEVLELSTAVDELNVIHVAGTKGKGSTCAFVESILRTSGFSTGLYTSPHLIDVRERFCFNGKSVEEEVFHRHFWWCWDRLKENVSDALPMPAYFRFLTLLAFRMFTQEKVDVVILEVGLGGRYDATNVVKRPMVCGITPLGFDHMEILGNTLPQIAAEKAGILKPGVPAITSPQREDAMEVLKNRASELDIPISLVPDLSVYEASGTELVLGLGGQHQRMNAAVAVALCQTWAHRTGHTQHLADFDMAVAEGGLPKPYVVGLREARWAGRAQIVEDSHAFPSEANPREKPAGLEDDGADSRSPGPGAAAVGAQGGLTFFLDGAHTPESMEVCAEWFAEVATGKAQREGLPTRRVLLFNCMQERDPQRLLPPLVSSLQHKGLPLHRAIFAPGTSAYTTVQSSSVAPAALVRPPTPTVADLRWQFSTLDKWEALQATPVQSNPVVVAASTPVGAAGSFDKAAGCEEALVQLPPLDFLDNGLASATELSRAREEVARAGVQSGGGGAERARQTGIVAPSLPDAIDYLRQYVRRRAPVRLQVLVTGSLHFVGDVLRLLRH